MRDRAYWFWCWLCFRAYLALPMPRTHESLYGRLSLWMLGYAGFYAHTPSPYRSRTHPSHEDRPE